ncbi:hypothetical protein QZH41_014853, partial [Actinostola sp. cb2023]
AKSSSPNLMYPDNVEVLSLASVLSSSSPRDLYHKFINQSLHQYGESIFSFTTVTRKIPFTYVISLWRRDAADHQETKNQQCFINANPHSHQLKKTVKSLHPVYTSLFQHVVHWKQSKQATLAERKKAANAVSVETGYVFLSPLFVLLYSPMSDEGCDC